MTEVSVYPGSAHRTLTPAPATALTGRYPEDSPLCRYWAVRSFQRKNNAKGLIYCIGRVRVSGAVRWTGGVAWPPGDFEAAQRHMVLIRRSSDSSRVAVPAA